MGIRDLATKSTKVTNLGTAIAVPFSDNLTEEDGEIYLARFAPYAFFVPFVVNCLEFVSRVLSGESFRARA